MTAASARKMLEAAGLMGRGKKGGRISADNRAARRKADAAQPDCSALCLEKLASSGLDARDGKALMMGPADRAAMREGGVLPGAALAIPYFGLDGRPTGFHRWRYLEDPRPAIQRRTAEKPPRYVQTPGTLCEAYFPPLEDWRAVAADPKRPVVFTEGELKAAACTKHCRPCVGLGGVYSFRAAKRGLPSLPFFSEFEWSGRDVVVAYDSDASSNPMVVAARNELCRELLSRGALPRVASVLPDPETGAKRGLDDVVVGEGAAALEEMLDAALPFAASEALHDLNAEVAYVRDPGLVVVLEDGQTMRSSDFTGHAYANRHYYETALAVDKDGKAREKFTKRKAAQAWLEWPERMELSRMAYEPGQERITPDRAYNTWPGWGCQPEPGDVGPWAALLDHLFEGKPEERSWFERWCALPLQRPGTKMYTCAVIWGSRHGTGKSLVGTTLHRIYGRNYALIGDEQLEDSKNAWAEKKQFVMGDDVTGQEQRRYADRLKAMITREEVRIDVKYVPTYTVRDVLNYYFTSNQPDAFFLEDDDRRNFVHEMAGGPLPDEFYASYRAWLDGTGPRHLFAHLLALDLEGMEPQHKAPRTSARDAMIEDGLSDLGRWVRQLRDDPDSCLRLGAAKMPGDLWSAADLRQLYDPEGRTRVTAGGVGRELKRAGLRQAYGGMPVKTASGQARLFACRNADQWLRCSSGRKIAEHYDSTRGLPGGRKKF